MKKFAVFDIDGTLIRWQLYHAVVDTLAKRNLLGNGAHKKLTGARMAWKHREHDKAFMSYESTLIDIYEQALPSLDTKTFDNVAEEVAKEYKQQVYTYTRGLVQDLKKKGYMLLAISGSHQELVEHVARQYGFDDWVGTEYQRRGRVFTGKKFLASSDKKSILNKLIDKHGLSKSSSWAVGDSKSDAAMLDMVTNPIAFNPDRELFEIANKKHWPVIIERKNVIYKLEAKNDRYILAQTK